MGEHHLFVGSKPAVTLPEPQPFHVMLATPTTRGLCPAYGASLAATIEALSRHGFQFTYRILANDCHVDDCRNVLIREFLKSDCTDLFFLDSDMGWQARDFLRLLKENGDIVAGVYRHKTDIETYPFHPGEGERTANEDGLYDMPKAATGFMRIRRPVLEALHDFELKRKRVTWAKNDDRKDLPMARIVERAFVQDLPFETEVKTDQGYHSGDYVLCLKARHLGFSVLSDIELPMTHTGEKIWLGHAGNYLRAQKGLDHPEFVKAARQLRDFPEKDTYEKLVFHSPGNPTWCFPPIGLQELYDLAINAKGPIIEFGTGLSTLVVGAALTRTKSSYGLHSVEHDLKWIRRVTAWLQTYDIGRTALYHSPITPYQSGDWYGIAPNQLPNDPDIVLIDGPPFEAGQRNVVFEEFNETLRKARVWVIDDCDGELQSMVVHKYAVDRDIQYIEATSAGAPHTICIATRRD